MLDTKANNMRTKTLVNYRPSEKNDDLSGRLHLNDTKIFNLKLTVLYRVEFNYILTEPSNILLELVRIV